MWHGKGAPWEGLVGLAGRDVCKKGVVWQGYMREGCVQVEVHGGRVHPWSVWLVRQGMVWPGKGAPSKGVIRKGYTQKGCGQVGVHL